MGGLGQGGGAGTSSLFKQRDKNNDGKLGKDEIPAALYERLDSDKDGFVTDEELKALRKPN
jgi:Ca2+-binding EF-hand superfamily protein